MSEPVQRKLVLFSALTPELKKAIDVQYPDGWANQAFSVTNNKNEKFYALNLTHKDVKYLIKFTPAEFTRVVEDEEDDDDFGGDSDDIGGDDFDDVADDATEDYD